VTTTTTTGSDGGAGGGGEVRMGKLTLVDLAGCERVDESGVRGAALAEAQRINASRCLLCGITRQVSRSHPD
jgi:hypothetical protein